MKLVKVVHEYIPGEYCRVEGCELYRQGRFRDECAFCEKYVFYNWLHEQGYRLLKVTEHSTKDEP